MRFGVFLSVEELVEELRPEFSRYTTSGGGVTFTGGEPTLYPEFMARLSKSLRHEGIDVALETCGFFNLEMLQPLLQELQLVLFDIKVDEAQHRRLWWCGKRGDQEDPKSLVGSLGARKGRPFLWLASLLCWELPMGTII